MPAGSSAGRPPRAGCPPPPAPAWPGGQRGRVRQRREPLAAAPFPSQGLAADGATKPPLPLHGEPHAGLPPPHPPRPQLGPVAVGPGPTTKRAALCGPPLSFLLSDSSPCPALWPQGEEAPTSLPRPVSTVAWGPNPAAGPKTLGSCPRVAPFASLARRLMGPPSPRPRGAAQRGSPQLPPHGCLQLCAAGGGTAGLPWPAAHSPTTHGSTPRGGAAGDMAPAQGAAQVQHGRPLPANPSTPTLHSRSLPGMGGLTGDEKMTATGTGTAMGNGDGEEGRGLPGEG